MTDSETLQKTIEALEAKSDRITERLAEIGDERKAFGFAIVVEKNKTAAGKLEQLNGEATSLTATAEAIGGALEECRRRLTAAQANDAAAIDRTEAKELSEALEVFVTCGEEIDKALEVFVDASVKMRAALARMHGLGRMNPSLQQFQVIGKNSLFEALHRSPWAQFFPRQLTQYRVRFADLTERWATGVAANVQQRLGKEDDKAA
jgi:chromosome segregation ATPase